MNFFRSIALAGLLALSPMAAFAKDFSNALTWAPDNAEAVLALDTDGMSKSGFFKAVQPAIFKLAGIEKTTQSLKKDGVDLIDVVDSIVFISAPAKGTKSKDPQGIVVLEGNFATPAIKKALETQLTKDFKRQADGTYTSNDAVLSISDKEIVVLSLAYAEASRKAKKLNKPHAALSKLTKTYGSTGHAVVAVKHAKMLSDMGLKLPPLENAAIRLDFSNSLKLDIIANAADATQANKLAAEFTQAVKDFAASPDAKDIGLTQELKAATVKTNNTEVILSVSLSSSKALSILDML